MREAHGQDGVAGHDEGSVGGKVRARAAMRLKVCVIGTEQFLGAGNADVLGDVDVGASAVVPAPGVALGVLVAQG